MREKRPKQRTTTKDRLTDSHEDISTYTCTCTTNNNNNNNSEHNKQPHIGSYTFACSSFTTAWRAETPSSSVPSSLWSTVCLLCLCFIAMLFIDKRSCVRTCTLVLYDCPKILIVSFRDTNAQTTKRHDNKTTATTATTSAMTMMKD